MRKINTNSLTEESWSSPKGKFAGAGKEILIALEQNEPPANFKERCPFDVEILRVPAGKTPYPYHSHSAQWEFYHVISGKGIVRAQDGTTTVEPGDAFVFGPGQAHQLTNNGTQDLVIYVVADNPVGESSYFPDSNKWLVRSPERKLLGSGAVDYYDGEE
jgi:mannose-6-phosphate isomerase-like protein (cupin superfamily)